MARAICPACKRALELDRHIEEGDFVNCYDCGADLELIRLHPLTLDWVADGLETMGVSRSWRSGAKRSKRDKRRGMEARVKRNGEFDYDDWRTD